MYSAAWQSARKKFGRRTVVVSGGGSARTDFGAPTSPAALANERPARKRRRLCMVCIEIPLRSAPHLAISGLQLALELVEKAPVGESGNDLVRGRLDHADFVEPKRKEPDGVFGVVVPPKAVPRAAQGHKRTLVREAVFDHSLRCPLRLLMADVGRPEDGAHRALGRHRIPAKEIGIGGHHAAEIVRPGRIGGNVDDDVPDVPRARLPGIGRRPYERVDLTGGEALGLADLRIHDPVDLRNGIEPDVGGHRTHEQMLGGAYGAYSYSLAPQIRDVLDAVVGTQFQAAHMDAGEYRQAPADIQQGQVVDRGFHADIQIARSEEHT